MSKLVAQTREQVRTAILDALGRAIAAGELAAEPISGFNVEVPADRANGDFSSNAAMASARAFKKAPRAIADAILKHMDLSGTYIDRCDF